MKLFYEKKRKRLFVKQEHTKNTQLFDLQLNNFFIKISTSLHKSEKAKIYFALEFIHISIAQLSDKT